MAVLCCQFNEEKRLSPCMPVTTAMKLLIGLKRSLMPRTWSQLYIVSILSYVIFLHVGFLCGWPASLAERATCKSSILIAQVAYCGICLFADIHPVSLTTSQDANSHQRVCGCGFMGSSRS